MYNANANLEEMAVVKGSTRLHMDMADALNIMTYAAPAADESIPAGAAWDIFRPEDSATIRDFMRRALHRTNTDPIHSQHYYLDDKLQTLADFETLDSLLQTARERHGLLRQQVRVFAGAAGRLR